MCAAEMTKRLEVTKHRYFSLCAAVRVGLLVGNVSLSCGGPNSTLFIGTSLGTNYVPALLPRWYNVSKTWKTCSYDREPFLVPVKTHAAALASTKFQRHTAKPAQEGLSVACACTGPVGTGLVPCTLRAVDKPWPNKMSTNTNIHTRKQSKKFKVPYPRMRANMRSLLSLENQEKKTRAARFARPSISSSKRAT